MAAEQETQASASISFGPFRLIAAERALLRGREPVALGGRALDVLIALIERAGEVVSNRELMKRAWPHVLVEEANLRVHIATLRKILGDGQDGVRYITNVAGRGYCFVAPIRRTVERDLSQGASRHRLSPQELPVRLHRMVGRDQAVSAVCQQLTSQRFVSVVGPGGIGKTTVAVAVAHALVADFGEAICFVDLGAINDAALVATTVASELGCAIQQDPLPDLIAFLADKQTLLILDSCEHVIGGAAELADRLLREAPLLHILATSQEALRIEGENVHLLPPLDSPRDDRNMTATEALASPAVQLFMDRASAGGYRSELTDAEAPEVAEICRRLGGIALAIELAASRVSTYGIHGTASLLGDRFALLWKGRRTAPPRHQTLQSTLDWSYNLFSPHERKVLRCLSVFAGIFTLEAAQAVADETGGEAQAFAEAITSLVEKARISIAPAGSANCYRLLDTTRAYATLKLAVSGEADAVARRHALYYADYLGSRALELAAAYGRREMSSFSQQLGNVLAALGWCFSGSGDKAIGVELAARAAPLFLGLSLYVECIRWCERALAALADTDRGTKRELALHEPLVISSIITNSYTEEVKDAPTRGLDLTGAQRDDPHLLDALAGDLRGAHATAARYVVVAEESGTPRDVVVARWLLGATQHLAGNQAAAQRSFEFGFRLAESAGAAHLDYFGHDHYARAHIALARVLWLRGMPDQAAGVAREAINVGARRGHPVTTCLCLFHATPVFLWCGDLDSAEDHIEQLIAQAAKHSLGVFSSGGLALRGELLIARGEMSGGIEALRSAYSDLRFPVRSSRALAEALACSGQAEEAAVVIAAAVAQGKQGIDPFELPDLLRAQGEILLASSSRNWTAAQELLIQSLEMAREQSSPGWELRSAIPLARLWARNGRAGEALEMLEAIYQRFQEGFATTDLVTASRLLDTLKESDPPQ